MLHKSHLLHTLINPITEIMHVTQITLVKTRTFFWDLKNHRYHTCYINHTSHTLWETQILKSWMLHKSHMLWQAFFCHTSYIILNCFFSLQTHIQPNHNVTVITVLQNCTFTHLTGHIYSSGQSCEWNR